MNRHTDTGALSLWDAGMESQFLQNLATIPAPLDPAKDPGVIDVTPETLGERATVAHIREWQKNRDRNAPNCSPTPPEAA